MIVTQENWTVLKLTTQDVCHLKHTLLAATENINTDNELEVWAYNLWVKLNQQGL